MHSFVRKSALVAAFLMSSAVPAFAAHMRGDEFVTMMDGNTLSGVTDAGQAFNLYFLAGGIVTYTSVAGTRIQGAWKLSPEGEVCVSWPTRVEVMEGCYRLSFDGNEISWRSADIAGRGKLRGGVMDSFVKPPK